MLEGYLTWQALGEWGTLITVTVVLVQFALRDFADWLAGRLGGDVRTQYVVYLTAAILMLLYRAVTGTLVWLDLPLIMISAVFAALAAMKLWETIAAELYADKFAARVTMGTGPAPTTTPVPGDVPPDAATAHAQRPPSYDPDEQ